MNIVGAIGSGLAFLRYQKAKADYETIEEIYDDIKSGVDSFNLQRKQEAESLMDEYHNPNDELNGVSATATLRIKSIGSNLLNTEVRVTLQNNSSSTYVIRQAEANIYVHDDILGFEKEQRVYINTILRPAGETGSLLTIKLPGGKAMFSNNRKESNRKLKEDIVYAGKGNTTLLGIQTADIRIKWKAQNGTQEYTAFYQQKKGSVTYSEKLYKKVK